MPKRDAILEAAAGLFAEKGFGSTSMAELCSVTGVAEGTIFYHFKTKVGLFVTVLEVATQAIDEAMEAYVRETSFATGLDMVEGLMNRYLYLADTMENRFLLLHRHYPYELAEANPRCKALIESHYSRLWASFESAVRKGQMDGSVNSSLEPRLAAQLTFGLVDGVVHYKTYRLMEIDELAGELSGACRRLLNGERQPA
jgi:AcrR family transcriptional regulator